MRTFLLGVGAQKVATTWLFRHIIHDSRFRKGLVKEYHLFNKLSEGFDSSVEEEGIRRRIRNYPLSVETDFENSLKTYRNFYTDPATYFDYFDAVLAEDGTFSSDITPAYAALSAKELAFIKDEFARRDIRLKVFYFMREPVTRFESSLRMALKRNGRLRSADASEVLQKLKTLLNGPGDMKRANYMQTCQQIDQVFDKEDVFYGFYETLFGQAELERLSQFLGVSYEIFDVNKKVNRTPKLFKYPKNDIALLREKVEERYQFVAERFEFDLSHWDRVLLSLIQEDTL